MDGLSWRAGSALHEGLEASSVHGLMELRDMSNAKRTLAIFGRRAVVVALSTLTIFSGVPTAALAEVQEEVTAVLEQGAADVDSQDTSADSASEQETQAEQQPAEESSQDASSEQDTSGSGDTSEQGSSSEQQAEPAATEADVALSGLDHATIKRVDGQELTTGATKVTVSTSEDFKFTVEPNNGYSLTAVKLTVSGTERELTADADDYYTVPAADILSGSSLKLETEEAADNSNSTTGETKSITEADDAEENADDESSDSESLINSIALSDDDEYSISGPTEVTMGDEFTLTFNGDATVSAWTSNSQLNMSMSSDKKTLTCSFPSAWAFDGDSTEINVYCEYVDPDGTWHTGTEGSASITIKVNKRTFYVQDPPSYVPGTDHFWMPVLIDSATGEEIDTSAALNGGFLSFEYYRDGVKIEGASQYYHDEDEFSKDGVYTVVVKAGSGWVYKNPGDIVIVIPDEKGEDTDDVKYIYVGETLSLEGSNSGWYDTWSNSDDGVVTLSASYGSSTASVKGLKVGSTTVVHTYEKRSGRSWKTYTDKYTIHVLKKPAVKELVIYGDDTVEQFKNIALTTNVDGAYDVTWTSSDPSVATIDAAGKVVGVKQGTVTITATTVTEDGTVLTATHDVTVTASSTAAKTAYLFFQNSPTANPASNDSADWLPAGGSCTGTNKLTLNLEGATWDSNKKNTYDNVSNRVVSWPDGSTGTSWELNKTTYANYWRSVYNAWKSTLEKEQGTTITEDDIESIVLHPYKISNNSSGYHLDCKVEVKCKKAITVNFYLQDAGATGFAQYGEGVNYKLEDGKATVAAPSETPADTKTYGGITYKFMGWYTDEACTKAVSFPVTVTGNVNYYAKYVPMDQTVKVNYYLDGTTTPVAPSQTLTGLIKGTKVTQSPIVIDGYTAVDNSAVTVVVGETQEINFYYTRNQVAYTVEYYWNGTDEKIADDETGTGAFGDSVEVSPKSIEGYTAVSSEKGKIESLSANPTENVIKFYYYKDVTLTAKSSTVEYSGEEQSVTGYDSNAEGVTFEGVETAGGKGTDAGEYAHTFADGTVGKVDTTNKYVVAEAASGKLTITPSTKAVTIKVAGNNGGEKYNGTEQTVSDFTVDESTLPAGISASDVVLVSGAKAEAKGTNAGTYDMGLTNGSFTLSESAAKNYANVTFDVTDGALTIAKRQITLWSEDDHKNYDGKTLTRETDVRVDGTKDVYNNETDTTTQVTYEGDGFVDGEGIEGKTKTTWYNQNGESDQNNIAPGVYDNMFTVQFKNGTNSDNYEITYVYGKLYVNKRAEKDKYKVTVNANSAVYTYNGSEQGASGVYASVPSDKQGSASGMTFTDKKSGAVFTISGYSASVAKTDAGTYDNVVVVGDVKVIDEAGNDVTDEFVLTTVDGKLTINPKAATITAGSAEKEYDGQALTTSEFKTDGFVEGEGIESATIEGSQTLVGSSQSSVKDGSWKAKNGTNLNNYSITTQPGTLTVTDRTARYQITLEGIVKTETYNGSDQVMYGVKTDTFEFNGETFQVKNYKSDVTGKDAGDYTQTITSANEDGHWSVVDSKGNDVSAQFSVTAEAGKLTIAPKDVTITSGSASKTYDGTALTKNEASVTDGGFVEGEEAGVSYTYTGSQTDVGTSKNYFDVVFDGTNAKASNYNVTKVEGDLTVDAVTDKVTVTITEHGNTLTYDGDEHTVTGYDVSSDNELYTTSDFTFSGTASVSGTDAGAYEMQLKASDFQNISKNFTNVEFVIVDGTLTINKRAVELTSGSGEKVYDGMALTNKNVTVTNGSFAKSDSFTAATSGTITNVGSVDNEFTYELTGDGAKKDDEGNYVNYTVTTKTGNLDVTPVTSKVTVTITGNKASTKYDGTEKSASGYTVSIDNPLYKESDFTYTGSFEVKQTNAGTYAMGLKDGKFENKSDNFTNVEFVVADGELAIAKREVTLTSADDSKTYDGTPLTNGTVTVSGDGFVGDEGADYSVTGSQLLVGWSPNAFSYTLTGGATEGENGNYVIKKVEGTLTVTEPDAKFAITVTGNSAEYTYDGTEHSVSGVTQTEYTFNNVKYTVEAVTSNPSLTDAGSAANEVTSVKVKDADGSDVTSLFAVTPVAGELKVNKRTVKLTAASDEKTYDGTALVNATAAASEYNERTGEGFVNGEGVSSYVVTGSQTNAGSSANVLESYELNANTNAKNYTITTENGTLKVNPVSDKVTVTITENSDTKTYNGYEQSIEGYTYESSNALYTESCFSFVGDASHKVAKGTFVGQYDMSLVPDDFKNVSDNFTNVEFVIVDGLLEITPDGIDVDGATWDKKDVEKFYDGTALVAYTASAKGPHNDDLEVEYSLDKEHWTKNPAEISLTHAGTVTVYLRARTSNYTEGKYAFSSETITVKPRSVTLTSGTKSKVYDGTALTCDSVAATERDDAKGEGFVGDEGATYDVTGTITNVGETANAFTYTLKSNTQGADYVITQEYGKLIVAADDNEVVVTIKGNSDTVTYDGNEHTVSGYTVSITGGEGNFTEGDVDLAEGHDATISGTNVLVSSDGAIASYEDELSADDFVSTNENFSNVKFVIDATAPSVSLTINKRDVTLTSESGTWPYDGESHSKPEVTSSDELFSSQVSDLKATGSVMHAGDGEVPNTITYTPGESFKETNYNITKNEGTLTVTERGIKPNEVTWTKSDVVKTYDGNTYTAGVATATDAYGQELKVQYSVDGDTWYDSPSDIKATNVSESKTIKLRATSGDYSDYATETEELTINQAELKVATPDATKPYDGTALTAAGTITGFVNGETAKFETTGSQTYVGESENSYSIDWESSETTAKQGNYAIVATLGTLVVTAPTDNSKVVTKTHTAGTYALGQTVTFTIKATNVYDSVKTMTLEELTGVTLSQSEFKDVQPGATVSATATYTITEADILAGTFVNTVTVKFSGEDKDYPNTDEVDVEKANAHLTVSKTTTSTPKNGSTYALGEQITYDVKVANDGNLTANDVVVEDQLEGATLADGQSAEVGTLAPGESKTVKYVYTVTEADILAGKVTNNATASGNTDDGDPTVTPGKTEDETNPKNGHITVKKTTMSDPADGVAYKLGETIEYDIDVKNDGNLTVTGITVTDPNGDDFGEQAIESLAPGETATFKATHVVTEADVKAGEVVNVATATGTSPDPDKPEVPVVPGKDTDSTETAKAALTVVKTAEQSGSAADGAFKLGETINYTITVTNTGNQTVENIRVVDPKADNFGEQTVESLAPGKSATFTATHVVTEADILAGTVVNSAIAKGVDSDGKTVVDTGEDTKNIEDLNTTLSVTKTASKPADKVSYKLDETVTYTITVTNNGNVTYKNVKVTDAKTGLDETIDSLGVGESKTFTTTHVIDENDIAAGSYANGATATADPVVDPKTDTPVTPSGKDTETIGGEEGEDPIDEGKADLVVSKKVTNEGKGTGKDGAFKLGDVIEYEITVTNNGNLTAMNFQVTDENADNFTPVTIESLAPGKTTKAFRASHTVTSSDILAGKVVNVATTTGGKTIDPKVDPKPTPGEVDTDTDKLDTTLEVTKKAAAPVDGKSYKLGESVNYTITVTNKGNVPYTNVVVTDAQTGFSTTVPKLGVNETKTFTTQHVVTEADIVNGSYTNTATAIADPVKDPETGEDVYPSGTGSETIGGDKGESPIDAADPKLVITKTSDVADGHLLKEDETVNYSVTVANVGNLTLTNVTVDDQLEGATLADGESATIESLAPGASQTLHYIYVVKQADVVAGSVKNHATATADNPSEKETDVTPGDKEDPTEQAKPSLFVSKEADNKSGVTAGDVITYTIKVTNNGNVNLTGVKVTDELVGFTSDSFDLAKGESKTFTQAYTVTEADMVVGSVKNVATATAKDPSGNVVPGSGETTSTTEAIEGALNVAKTAGDGSYAAGDTVEYSITVTNTGNVTVYDIRVTDPKTGLDETVTLAKGESKTYTTSYVVTDEDIKTGELENVATAKGTDPAGKDVEASDTETIDDSKQDDPDNPDKPTLKREMNVSEIADTVYNGKSQELKPTVTDKYGNTLVEGTDFTVTYSRDTTNVGEVTATITGKGNYTGTFTRTYKITPAALTVVTPDASKVYDGEALTAEGSYSGLVNGETIGFATTGNQTEAGSSDNTYKIEWASDGFLGLVGGNGYTAKESNYTVSDTIGTLTVTAQSIDPGTDPENPDPSYKGVTIDEPSDVTYDATEHKWSPVVTDKDGNPLVEGKDYAVTYGTDDFTNVSGLITVTITGIGSYSGTVVRTYQITPAELTVTTGSDSKTYDGAALTNSVLNIVGLKGSDYVTAATTGSQTEVGSSANTYSLVWSGALESNYRIVSESLGTLTVTEAPTPAPNPTPAPTPGNGGNTPNNGGSVVDAIADVLEDGAVALTGEEPGTETIYDAENPLGKEQRDACWVHFYMIIGMVVTAIYGACVVLRRRRFTNELEGELNDVLSADKEGSDE